VDATIPGEISAIGGKEDAASHRYDFAALRRAPESAQLSSPEFRRCLMKRIALAVGVVALAAVSLPGQTVPRTKPVLGAGGALCRAWNGDEKVSRNADGSFSTTGMSTKDPVQVSWILGYLSATGVTGRSAEPGGEPYIIGRISSACLSQPDRTLASVVADFAASTR
jgi:hypothetical protein